MDILNIFRIIVSALFVLFLPGFFLSWLFFDRGKIDLIERLALSFALSISVVPLVSFYANLAGVRVTLTSVILEVLLIFGVTAISYFLKKQILKNRK